MARPGLSGVMNMFGVRQRSVGAAAERRTVEEA
ncbi:hypothetical protein EV662_10656 [Rhodovulum marinum]|uniref:Uncharacterized protein n=1 Tax=Rhodovulum marinum TaxID=320662 RepID=A0A4R2PXC9_9RHOB|nr:hypothetical protein EV662_10656 [Rhodovulum marinum]